MLREILGVHQDEPHAERRWFHDDYFDLFVWQDSAGDLLSFELCYGIGSSERALVWERDGGFYHDGVEEEAAQYGEVLGQISKQGGADPIVARFDLAARSMPDALRGQVSERVHQYANRGTWAESRRKQFRRADWQQKTGTR
jgi:hypothetical protein